MTKGKVVGDERELLHKTWTEIDGKNEDLAKVVWKGMDEDRILGPCKVCEEAGPDQGGRLAEHAADHPGEKIGQTVRRLHRLESRIGADDPKSCDQTFPLPQRGDVFRLEERCSICDQTPRLKVQPFRGRPWNLCLNDDCESMQEMKKRRAEREAAKEAKEEMDEEAEAERRRGRGRAAEKTGKAKTRKPKSRKPTPPRAASNAPKPRTKG